MCAGVGGFGVLPGQGCGGTGSGLAAHMDDSKVRGRLGGAGSPGGPPVPDSGEFKLQAVCECVM